MMKPKLFSVPYYPCSVLLIGFLLTISIGGYNNREQMEKKAIAIGNAFQRAQLLSPENNLRANTLLNTYIDARIGFLTAAHRQK